MIEWLLFLPILVPLALALSVILPLSLSSRLERLVMAAVLLLEFASVLLNLLPFSHQVIVSAWTIAGFSIAFQFDGIAVLLLLLMLLVRAALWLTNPDRFALDPWINVLVASSAALVLASNPLTMFLSWIAIDAALFLTRLARNTARDAVVRSLALSQLMGLALFAGALFLKYNQVQVGILFVTLAFWARLGLFPFQWIYPVRGTDTYDLWSTRLVPVLAGIALWIRWPSVSSTPPSEFIAVLFSLHALAAVIWAWREKQPARMSVLGSSVAVAFVPLAILYGGNAGTALAVWSAFGYVFALPLFEIGLRWRAAEDLRVAKWGWVLALATIGAIPLTPGFPGRIGVLFFLWQSDEIALLLIAALAIPIGLAPLWNIGVLLEGSEPRRMNFSERAGLSVLLLGFILISFFSIPLLQGLGPMIADSTEAALTAVGSPAALVGMAISFFVLVLPFFISPWLRGLAHGSPTELRVWITNAGRMADLDWLERLASEVERRVGTMGRNLADFAERNPTLWILLVALWIAIFIFVPR